MSTINWTDAAAPWAIAGRFTRDRWGRRFIADTDLGLCCCVACHDLRTDHPIGGWEARGWDGAGLGECPTCRWQEADDAVYLPPADCSANQQAAGYYLSHRWQELVRFTDVNPSLLERYRW